MKRISSLVVLTIGSVMLFASTGEPRATGISGRSTVGCGGGGCHGTAANPNATVTISAPATVAPGGTVPITVTVSDPTVIPVSSLHYGGFNMLASAGLFAPAPGVQGFLPNEVGHNAAGNGQRSWTVGWSPRTLCDFQFSAAANAVNGDGVPSALDHWNLASASITLITTGDSGPPTAPVFKIPEAGGVYFSGSKIGQGLPLTLVIGGPQAISVTTSDDVGIDHVTMSVADATGASTSLGTATYNPSSNQFSVSWSAFVPGPFTLTAEAFDCSGHSSQSSVSVFVL